MENSTLADWAAWYDSCGKNSYRKTSKKTDIDSLPMENNEEYNDDQLLGDNPGVTRTVNKAVKKRTQARIIRSVWFNKEAESEKHYRELIIDYALYFLA